MVTRKPSERRLMTCHRCRTSTRRVYAPITGKSAIRNSDNVLTTESDWYTLPICMHFCPAMAGYVQNALMGLLDQREDIQKIEVLTCTERCR
jgi:hypothetical protein